MSKPSWMSDEQYAEYKMTEEYRVEMTTPDQSQFELPDDENDYCPTLVDELDTVIYIIRNSDMEEDDKRFCIGILLEAQRSIPE